MARALARAKGNTADAAARLGITVRQMRYGVQRYALPAVDWRAFNPGGNPGPIQFRYAGNYRPPGGA